MQVRWDGSRQALVSNVDFALLVMGDVAGDLSSRRGQVTGTRAMGPGVLVVEGQAPLGELEGYSARLKAMTQGRGAWTMNLSHYEQAPPPLQQKLAGEFAAKRKHEEEE